MLFVLLVLLSHPIVQPADFWCALAHRHVVVERNTEVGYKIVFPEDEFGEYVIAVGNHPGQVVLLPLDGPSVEMLFLGARAGEHVFVARNGVTKEFILPSGYEFRGPVFDRRGHHGDR